MCAIAKCSGLAGLVGTPEGFHPDPLTAISFFEVLKGNEGVLQFPIAAEGIVGAALASGPAAPPGTKFVFRVEGRISYRNEREELQHITNDPMAVHDTIVGFFADSKGRVNAEIVSNAMEFILIYECIWKFVNVLK